MGHPRESLARLRGLALARTNQTSQAEPLLRQAFDESRTVDPEVAEALARIYLGTFRLTAAGSVLDRWIREAAGDARPYLLRTEIDSRREVVPGILIAGYRAALQRDPGLDPARLGLADQLRAAHRNAEASVEYTAYLRHNPEDPIGYLGAGQNALELVNVAEAVRLLDRALALAPRDAVALAARATIELNQGRYQAALDYPDGAVQSDPFDAANRYQRMLILLRLGRKAEADVERQAVERIRRDQAEFGRISRDLHRSPEDPTLRSAAARWLMDHGHEEEAVEWASLVLRADPAHRGMNRLLAEHYRKKGQLGLANFYEAQAGSRGDDAVGSP
jgi:tetratricopeptide (TPR) repeat protein